MSGRFSWSIYVGNLPGDIREHEIENLFYKYGRIVDIELKVPPQPPCYCFVEFERARDAEDAIKGRDGYNFDGCRLRVELGGRGQSSSDRRGGYGGGGSARLGVSRHSEFRVIVRGLPSSASWQDLKDHMRKAGDVCFAEVTRDSDGTYGVVDYTNYDDMKYAIRKLDDTEFRNPWARAYIRVKKYESSQSRSPSRSRSRCRGPGRSQSRSLSRSKSPRKDLRAHEIDGNILTPARDHSVFPDISEQRRTHSHGLARFKEDAPSCVTDPKHHEDAHPSINAKTGEESVMDIVDEVNSSFNFEEFVKSRGANFGKSYHSGYDISKNIKTGWVQTHCNAARAALKMFEEGRDEEAKAIFAPHILLELMRHKKELKIYLSPFLYGMCYTSYGRHFTKKEKLEEIVERLHWYVENGDTVVDFGCGSNDFSCLMEEKLAKTGKSCFFKNFDLIPPKNYFNFEKRDWLSVKADELPDGSKLIIGLSPPFGHIANNFIRKALELKPKILILIVPSETKRVDAIADYELIWEDRNLLSGMSFYLPGSVDVNYKTVEKCNNLPPPLYLWSRRDWSRRHEIIAIQQGHITQMTYNADLHNVEISQGDDDNGMVQDMDISPADEKHHHIYIF